MIPIRTSSLVFIAAMAAAGAMAGGGRAADGQTGAPDIEGNSLVVTDDAASAPPADIEALLRAIPELAPSNTEKAGQCLSFNATLARVVENDPRIAEAASALDVQEAELSMARANRLPQIESFSRAGLGDGLQAENLIDNRVGVRVSQRIFGFGAGRFERRAAAARAEAAGHDINAARLAVAVEAAEAYMSALRAKARRAAAARIESYYARDAAMAERRLAKGLLTIAEANSIRAEFALAEANSAREDLRIAQESARLSSLLGAPFACGVEPSVSAFLEARRPPTFDEAALEAVARSPSLNAARATIREAQAESRRAGRAGLPQLSIGGTLAYDYDDARDAFERNDRFGLDISAPIFQGGRNRFAKRRAQARARGAEARLAREEQALREHLSVSWARVYHLHSVLIKQGAARDSFAELSAAAEREFELGALTAPELVNAKRDYYNAVLSEIDVRFELYAQELSLIADTGRLLD